MLTANKCECSADCLSVDYQLSLLIVSQNFKTVPVLILAIVIEK